MVHFFSRHEIYFLKAATRGNRGIKTVKPAQDGLLVEAKSVQHTRDDRTANRDAAS